ncbi:YPDG domain-containing protein [Corynebacterium sp. NML180780]|uniref:YPDG domain-containing protein n=1 Tax=Corynebacterium sp. NML180780 TaxID=2598459 RepID=UPI0011954414|nr:YPDG domain-containing protein [Corynebacterium sp. NML180780]TVX80332.1 hypothetical protein FPP74_04425 [Corynebacterium sp. NML180780]
MNWTTTPIVACAAVTTALVAPAALAADTARYTLTVATPAGPLEHVDVELTGRGGSFQATTDYAGRVSLDVPVGTYAYRATWGGEEYTQSGIELTADLESSLMIPGPERTVDYAWSSINVAAGSRATVVPTVTGNKSGVTVERIDGPEWAEVFTDGTVEAMPPANEQPGAHDLIVRTSAGQVETIPVRVTGPQDPKDVMYPVTQVRVGSKVRSAAPTVTIWHQGREFSSQPVPGGMTFHTVSEGAWVDANTGQVTLDTAASGAKAGDSVTVPLEVGLPSGATVEATAVFQVNDLPTAEQIHPGWETLTAAPGERVTVEQTGDADVPADAQFVWRRADNPELKGWAISVDPATGAVSATPSDTAKDADVNVRVSYSDGSQSTAPVHLRVAPKSASQQHTLRPGQEEEILAGGGTDVVIVDSGGADVTVDKHGAVKASVPSDAMRGAVYPVKLRVDGKETTVTLTADAPDQSADFSKAWWIPVVMVAMVVAGAVGNWAWTTFSGGAR